jgi:hypothetical protein
VTDERERPDDAERAFFDGERTPEAGPAAQEAAPPRRRGSALLARSPAFAVLALAACAWLLWEMWPDTAYFFSPPQAIDLGAPGSYHLERARGNRLVRIQGAPAAQVGASSSKGDERRVLGLFGTNLVVDRPAAAGAVTVFEGRLLPQRAATEYAPIVAALRERGFPAAEGWAVLRDGERPRSRWSRPLLSLVLLLVAGVNLRALVKHVVD